MIELTPPLDEASGEALYFQLYRYIRDEMLDGRIPPGTRLPSVRRLCGRLGLSRTPVAQAYAQLAAEGFIRSVPRSGLFAARLEGTAPEGASSLVPAERAALPPSPLRAYHAGPHEGIGIDFGYGAVDLGSFPLTKWRRLLNRCLLPENARILLYGDIQGEPGLRKQIAAYLHHTRGVRCSAEQIVVGAGTYHSLDLLLQLLEDKVTEFAAEEAVNDGVQALFRRFGYTSCLSLPLEEDGIRLAPLLKSRAQAVYVTPSHQFPFGMTLSAAKRLQLLRWAEERGAYIVENDYDGEFRFGGRPIPSLQGLDGSGRVVYIGTFSKALTPSFRLSYLVLPEALLAKFRQGRHSYDQLASPLLQETLRLFMQSGDFERHMRRMRTLYHKKHDVLLESIGQHLYDVARVIGAGSGLHILLQVRNGMDETRLVRSAAERSIKVYPTSAYAWKPEQAPPSTVLLGFGGLSEHEIRTGVRLLAESWM